MPRILKILIIFFFVLLVVTGITFFALRSRLSPAPAEDTRTAPDGGAPSGSLPSSPSPSPPPPAAPRQAVPADPVVQLKTDLSQLARIFAERWGSFSNQQSVSSLASLTSLMTASVQRFAADEGARLRAAHPDPAVRYVIQTRALNVKELGFNVSAGTASYLVATQRVEEMGVSSNRTVSPQDLEVRMVKEGGLWKVSGVYWKEAAR